MKKVFLSLTCCLAILIACNNETKSTENSDSSATVKDTTAMAPVTATDDTATASTVVPAATTATATTTEAATTATAAPAAEQPKVSTKKGEQLISKSDCLGCHKVNEKLVGPSYKSVAKKYTAKDTDKLVGKIINGGAGSWGEIPMSPHPTLSKADAKEMVRYILSLK